MACVVSVAESAVGARQAKMTYIKNRESDYLKV